MGLDLDLTPQASIDAPFKLRVQKKDFSNAPQSLGNGDLGLRTRPDEKDITVTLKDNVVRNSAGVALVVVNVGLYGFDPGFRKPVGGQKPVPLRARCIYDPTTKTPVQIIELAFPESKEGTGKFPQPINMQG